jgi:hypothetical protein
MARMSREFKLVLLGAGILTAGSFLWPDEDPVQRAEDDANKGGGGNGSRRGRTGTIIFFTSYTRTTTRTAAATSTSRGGFGRSGGFFSGG